MLQYLYSGIFLIFGRLGAKTHTNQRQDSEYFKNRLVLVQKDLFHPWVSQKKTKKKKLRALGFRSSEEICNNSKSSVSHNIVSYCFCAPGGFFFLRNPKMEEILL